MLLRAIIGISVCVAISAWAICFDNKYVSFTRDEDNTDDTSDKEIIEKKESH